MDFSRGIDYIPLLSHEIPWFSHDLWVFLWFFVGFPMFSYAFHAFPSKKHLKKNRPPATPRQPLAEGRLGEGFMVGGMVS